MAPHSWSALRAGPPVAMVIRRCQLLCVFLLMMMTNVVLAGDVDDESTRSRNRTTIDLSVVPGYRILLSSNPEDANIWNLALRPDPQTNGEGRGKMKNMMFPFMAIGQLFTIAFMPFMLMNLKAMAMNALMMNNMALTGAIALTIRNIFFNDNTRKRVIYPNVGYKKGEQHRPEYPPGILVKDQPQPTHHFPFAAQPTHHFPSAEEDVHHPQYVDAPPSLNFYPEELTKKTFTRIVDDGTTGKPLMLRQPNTIKPKRLVHPKFRPSDPLIIRHTKTEDD